MEQELIKFIVDYRDEVLWSLNNAICEDSTRRILEGEELALRKIEKKIRNISKNDSRLSQEQLEAFWTDK